MKEPSLEYIFHPRSVAVVGASAASDSWVNHSFVRSLLEGVYPGKVYLVNPNAGEIMGQKTYPSLREVPNPLDYVICAIPARLTPQLLEECGEKGVKVAHLYTSGFSETGEARGRELEAQLLAIARRRGLRLIGPNCIGLYCPKTGLAFTPGICGESGAVAFISQSGGNARELTDMGLVRGLRFSKVISFGNALDLGESDLLEYLTQDPETKVIGGYVEGPRDGRRFVRVLREACRTKPVILLKGGRSRAGTRAVASHTGSLAGSEQVWESLFRQMGVVSAEHLEEMVDLLVTFAYLKPPQGRRVVVIGAGGGSSVEAADACERAGLVLPTLPTPIREELRKFTPEAGTGVGNPVDAPRWSVWGPSGFLRTLRLVEPEADLLLCTLSVAFGLYQPGPREQVEHMDTIIEASRTIPKPIAVALRTSGAPESSRQGYELQQRCFQARLPTYPTIGRAARAIAKFLGHRAVMARLYP